MDMLFLRLCSCMLKVNLDCMVAIFEIIYVFYQVLFRISYLLELCLVFSLKQQIHQWSFTWLNLKICNHFSFCAINMLDPNIACSRNSFWIFEIKKACLGFMFSIKLLLQISPFKFQFKCMF